MTIAFIGKMVKKFKIINLCLIKFVRVRVLVMVRVMVRVMLDQT